jgi:hypothetical protein
MYVQFQSALWILAGWLTTKRYRPAEIGYKKLMPGLYSPAGIHPIQRNLNPSFIFQITFNSLFILFFLPLHIIFLF